MRTFFACILVIVCVLPYQLVAQTVLNGNFNSNGASWGCSPEVNAESVYGGSSNSNLVAEVDALAGLCQTISGFTAGSYYKLSFLCSRRTTCGPTVQTMNVSMSGGVMNRSVSRNGTAFSLTTEFIYFYANAATHTLTFTGTTTETCNLLVDNIQISLVSALPVELSAFKMTCSGSDVIANWTTESEARTDHFTIEGSADGTSWKELGTVAAQQNSQTRTQYSYTLENAPLNTTNYYRLRLTDLDGTQEILSLVSLNCKDEQAVLYPNPTKDMTVVRAPFKEFEGVFDASGREVVAEVSVLGKQAFQVDLSVFSPGLYYLKVGGEMYKVVKN